MVEGEEAGEVSALADAIAGTIRAEVTPAASTG
jgi:hypothetical protein